MPVSESLPDAEPVIEPRSGSYTIGISLIVASCLLWFVLFAVPFLPLTVGQRAATGGGLFVVVQIFWWSGAALAGPKAVARFRSWYNRKKPGPARTATDQDDRHSDT